MQEHREKGVPRENPLVSSKVRNVLTCENSGIEPASPRWEAGDLPLIWLDYSSPTEASRVRFPAGSAPGFRIRRNLVGRCRWSAGFLGIYRFPRPCIPALLHTHFASPSSALKTSMLRAVQIYHRHKRKKLLLSTVSHYKYPPGRGVGSARRTPNLGNIHALPVGVNVRMKIKNCRTTDAMCHAAPCSTYLDEEAGQSLELSPVSNGPPKNRSHEAAALRRTEGEGEEIAMKHVRVADISTFIANYFSYSYAKPLLDGSCINTGNYPMKGRVGVATQRACRVSCHKPNAAARRSEERLGSASIFHGRLQRMVGVRFTTDGMTADVLEARMYKYLADATVPSATPLWQYDARDYPSSPQHFPSCGWFVRAHYVRVRPQHGPEAHFILKAVYDKVSTSGINLRKKSLLLHGAFKQRLREVRATIFINIWRADEDKMMWPQNPECKGGGKRETSEKTRQPAASSSTTPTCENPGVTPPGIEPGLPSTSLTNHEEEILSNCQTGVNRASGFHAHHPATCNSITRAHLYQKCFQTPSTGRSSPTKTNRVQSPAGSLPDFRMWESCRTTPLVGGFYQGSPISPDLSFRCCSILTLTTLIGSHQRKYYPLTNEMPVTGPSSHCLREVLGTGLVSSWLLRATKSPLLAGLPADDIKDGQAGGVSSSQPGPDQPMGRRGLLMLYLLRVQGIRSGVEKRQRLHCCQINRLEIRRFHTSFLLQSTVCDVCARQRKYVYETLWLQPLARLINEATRTLRTHTLVSPSAPSPIPFIYGMVRQLQINPDLRKRSRLPRSLHNRRVADSDKS
ncbi:hypothetical protein PR048_021256 [Dryococelus australis]|uniref:Uncharacterized protein n=1 Tax=Dryococelus australis TaxID=614101 RepID=A0ABQ9GXS7_9NEOP|nr:hypothetical protein PR048_021256 [Dryococelus australis]